MSKIEEMIKRLCPNGVDMVRLGDYIDIYTGEQLNKSEMQVKGSFPVINGGILPSGYVEKYNEPTDTITISQGGASAGYVNFMKTPFWAGAHCFVIRSKKERLYNRYLYYYIKEKESYLQQSQQGAGIPSINRTKINGLQIPLPDPAIQHEIVSVLDSFTTLIDKMKQEVVLRKKQMENYRGMLFAKYKGEVQKMKNFVLLKAGKTISSSELSEIPNSEHRFKCYGGNGIRGYASNFIYEGNYAIIGRQGALCGSVNWVNEKFYATEHAVICFPKPNVESRFLYWLFVNSNLNQYKSQGAQPGLAVSRLNELCFPIPSISTQRSIVSTLDAFEQYISKLERLITLRQKQYAYYREKLLTFE